MTELKNCAKCGIFIVPSNLAIFWRFWKFCFARNFGAFWKIWFGRNYLCPPLGYLLSPPSWMGYLLSPPTRPSNLAIFGNFWTFCFAHIFLCPSFQGIYCPLQLTPLTRQFFGNFWKSCFARNYLCPLILQSHLCSSCCSSSMCLLFYP